MARKIQWRYTYHVTKRYRSSGDSVYEDQYFDLSLVRDNFDLMNAEYAAKKLVKDDCSSNYSYNLSLSKVEQI